MLAVGENLVLLGQERPARVDEVEAGQAVGRGDSLRPQVLLDRDRVVSAAFHGGVVGDHHAVGALNAPDPRDQAAGGDRIVV